MNIAAQEVTTLIEHYKVIEREISLEGEAQLASIARVMKHHLPLTITKLKRLQELECLMPRLIEKIRRLEEREHGSKTG